MAHCYGSWPLPGSIRLPQRQPTWLRPLQPQRQPTWLQPPLWLSITTYILPRRTAVTAAAAVGETAAETVTALLASARAVEAGTVCLLPVTVACLLFPATATTVQGVVVGTETTAQ